MSARTKQFGHGKVAMCVPIQFARGLTVAACLGLAFTGYLRGSDPPDPAPAPPGIQRYYTEPDVGIPSQLSAHRTRSLQPQSDPHQANQSGGYAPGNHLPDNPYPQDQPGVPYGPVEMSTGSWDEGYVVDPSAFPRLWWGVTVEALFLNREGESGASLSTGTQLNDFGYEMGGRFTLDRHFDSVSGWSLTYTGPYDWDSGLSVAGVGLDSPLIASGGASVSAFVNAQSHQETYRSTFHSLELQYKEWAWDVMTFYYGGRFIKVDEDLVFNSVGALGEIGQLTIATQNNLGGGQAGMDIHLPFGIVSSTARLKGGLLANFAQSNVSLVNDGTLHVNNSPDDVEFAAILEAGYFATVNLAPNVRLRGGYEVWWLYGLATAPAQLVNPVTPATGSSLSGDNDVFYHGGSAGIEVAF